MKTEQTAQERFNQQQLALARPRLEQVADYARRGLGPTEIGKLLGLDRRRAWQLIQRARELGLLAHDGQQGRS